MGALAVLGVAGFGLALTALHGDPLPPAAANAAAISAKAAAAPVQPVPSAASTAPEQLAAVAVEQTATVAARPVPAARTDKSAPERSDPRWARDIDAPAATASSVDELADRLREASPDASPDRQTAEAYPALEEPPIDADAGQEIGQEQTASIPPRPQEPATTGKAPTRTASVNTAVRMRARPENGSAIVTTVGRGVKVGVVDCRGWCEVVYDGKRGFIAAKFIGARAHTKAKVAVSAVKTQAKEAETAKPAETKPAAAPVQPAASRLHHR